MSKNDKETPPKIKKPKSGKSKSLGVPDGPRSGNVLECGHNMAKEKTTTVNVVLALCALSGVVFAILEYRTPMIATVKGGFWGVPESVEKDLKATDSKINPNRMTAVDANAVGSMYLVCIHNKSKHKMDSPEMNFPKAVHWQISWEDPNGLQRKEYSTRETVALPPIACMSDMDVTVWVASEPTRPNAKKILITQDDHGKARLNIRTPVFQFVQCFHEHTRKMLWISIILAISVAAKLRRKLGAIGAATWFPGVAIFGLCVAIFCLLLC